MAEIREDSACKVRELIFAYESQNNTLEPAEAQGRKRAKSIGNALSYKLFREPELDIHTMVDIEKELVRIEAHLNYYEVYEKETHVAFQEQLFNVLTTIVNVDPEDHEGAILKKKKLIAETQKLARILNGKLPFGGNVYNKGLKRSYSNVVTKEEAVVSTTVHKSVLSTSHSTINGTFKSEDSLNSTRDSDVFSPKLEDCSSIVEEPINKSNEVVIEESKGYLPSVSRLKKFFSFRRDEPPKVNVMPVTYSGISRSRSFNVQSGKYIEAKREFNKTVNEANEEQQETISGSDETATPVIVEESKTENMDATDNNESIGTNMDIRHNVSVSKLKSMFEEVKKETDEGVGLLTKKQTEFRTDFMILPYTEANLGAFRLKRTISGNYMNFTGLLRKIDIQKKVDLNKSKSMSDLKSETYLYEGTDLSNELDEDEDYVHVTIDVNEDKSAPELNNNVENSVESAVSQHQLTHENSQEKETSTSDEVYTPGKVQTLKKNFESLSVGKKVNNFSKSKNDYLDDTLHRTVGPINGNSAKDPILKIPIQLRTDVVRHSLQEESSEEVNDVSYIIHRTIDPSPSNSDVEPILEMPIQLRGISTSNEADDVSHIIHRTIGPIPNSTDPNGEPILKVPIQLRGIATHNEADDVSHIIHRTIGPIPNSTDPNGEPILKVPIQLRGIATHNEADDVSHIIHRTIGPIPNSTDPNGEPILKVPIQLRGIATHNENSTDNKTEETVEQSGLKITESIDKKNIADFPQTRPVETSSYEQVWSSELESELHEQLGKPDQVSTEVSNISIGEAHKSFHGEENVPLLSNKTNPSESNAKDLGSNTIDLDRQETVNIQSQKVQVGANSYGMVDTLKQTFEHLNTKSEENESETISHVVQKTIESVKPNEDNDDANGTVNSKLAEEHLKVAEVSSPLNSEESSAIGYSNSHNISLTSVSENPDKSHLQVPVDLRLRDEEFPSTNYESKSEEVLKSTNSVSSSRVQLQSSTGSLQILQSPTAMATLMSSSSLSQSSKISSSTKVSVSYSEKTNVQHTSSTKVSHKVVSSSSNSFTQHSSSSGPYSINSLSSPPDQEESTVTITEIKDEPKEIKKKINVKLTDSQEQLLDDLIEDADSLHSYEDEFEDLVDQYK